MPAIPTMPTQGTAVDPQHGAGMGEFHLESFKVSVWHLWLHLQFKLVYFLLFSFYSTEFSACERCWIVIPGDWKSFIYTCNRYTLSSGNVIPLCPTLPLSVLLMLKKYLLGMRITFQVAVAVLMSNFVWMNLREIWTYLCYGVLTNKTMAIKIGEVQSICV